MKTYKILFVNKYLRDIFGDVVGKTCWEVLQNKKSGQCDFCTNEKLLSTEGTPTGVHVWEHQVHTFCQIAKKIGVQQTLNEVGYLLMKELQGLMKSPYMRLYHFGADHQTLFVLSDRGTETIKSQEAIKTALDTLNGFSGPTISPNQLFTPPLIPDDFPSGKQIIVPLINNRRLNGALLVAGTPEYLLEQKTLDMVASVLEHVSGGIRRAVLHEEEVRDYQDRLDHVKGFCGILGKDPKMQLIYKLIDDVASTDATVLIEGESGTGKELVARAIHEQSPRRNQPFVVINCAAYPATLLESELFGHEKGAFTGAIRRKAGRFEQAHGGTVFLDEIGEISPTAQIKLLRVLQTHQLKRLGGNKVVEVDVRILAATNKELVQEVKRGNFREDLFYRLNVIPMLLPPLRERRNDIPLLAQHFRRRFAQEQGKDVQRVSSEAMNILFDYRWPGNVRELENTIEHAIVLAKGEQIEAEHLPLAIREDVHSAGLEKGRSSLLENERKILLSVLDECGWNKKKAAEWLGISRSTLYDKLRRYQITKRADGQQRNNVVRINGQ
jgi:two-component system response regulator HydG